MFKKLFGKTNTYIELYIKNNSKKILLKLKEDKDLSEIPNALWLLLSNDEELKLITAQLLHEVITSISTTQLKKVDSLFRERTSLEWSYDWRRENPKNLITSSMSECERTTIFGLCSFHPNGYFREKAIKALSNMSSENTLPYLLIRLNDWVGIVRDCAKKSVKNLIGLQDARVIVNNLPLVIGLRNCTRYDHSDIINDILSILLRPECYSQLERGLTLNDEKVRRYCYEIIIENGVLNNKIILDYILEDSSPYNRLLAIRNIKENISLEELEILIKLFLSDKFAPIRKLVLEVFYEFDSRRSVPILKDSLFDRHYSVRETARYLLKNHCNYDFASLYRNKLKTLTLSRGAIYGMGETGRVADTIFIVPFLDHERSKIIQASIRALSNLDFETYKDIFITLITDSRPGVSKEARKVLTNKVNIVDVEEIYDIFKESELSFVQKNAAILLGSIKNKWETIRYIVEICANIDEEISQFGYSALNRWKIKFNRSYILPSKKQVLNIKEALTKYGDTIGQENKQLIEFYLSSY